MELSERFNVHNRNINRWAGWGWPDDKIYKYASAGPVGRGRRS